MLFENKNIVNIFKPATINEKSLSLFVFALLPSAFVTKTIESTLIYLLLTLIFLILATLVSKLIDKIFKGTGNFKIASINFVIIAVFITILSDAFFIEFTKEFSIYITLLAFSSIPYMLKVDNKNKTLNKGMLNTLQTFIGFSIFMIIIAVFREVLGTGMITFGTYLNISFEINLFKDYALTIISNPMSTFIIIGLLSAFIKSKESVIK